MYMESLYKFKLGIQMFYQLLCFQKISNNTQMIDLKWEQMNNNFADITLAKEMELKEKER